MMKALTLMFVLVAASASAQYIDHRTYPVDFASIAPGDAVADHPGLVWRHDGTGWYWQPAPSAPPQAPAPAPTTSVTCKVPFDPYRITLAEMLACTSLQPKPINPWTGEFFHFEVGRIYRWTIDTSDRVFVLSIALDPATATKIVTGRRIIGGKFVGDPVTFFESRTAWVPLQPGETP